MPIQTLQDAVLWAAELHFGQIRDGEPPVPYIAHPLEVMSLLRYTGGVTDTDMLAGAVLHDVVEDCNVKVREVEERFGPRVALFVREMTRREPTAAQIAGMDRDAIWELRSGMLLDEIRKMPPEVWPLKLADRLSNLREAKHVKRGKKLARYLRQTRTILEIIPASANMNLWKVLRQEVPRAKESQDGA